MILGMSAFVYRLESITYIDIKYQNDIFNSSISNEAWLRDKKKAIFNIGVKKQLLLSSSRRNDFSAFIILR
jgi:hypothetical protein